jgi:NAD(P)-dependent dehydrogenase (short-subunit alcohol dehydrogenase family)
MTGTIVIVGATGAIGSATARLCRQQGHAVHLVGRNPEQLAALAAELEATHAVADVMDEDALRTAVAAGGEGVSGLVYAVGSIDLKPARRATRAEAVDVFTRNALGALTAVQAVLEPLKANRGGVVLFSTVAVGRGFANHSLIAMAKGAVEGLVTSLAAELAPQVRVNAVAPSLTESKIASGLLANEKIREALAAAHPLGRIGTPQDSAAAALYLLGAGWVTGQVLHVDGGRSTVEKV